MLIIGWLVLALCVGVVASSRGRSAVGWFLLSVCLSPIIGLILVAVMPPKTGVATGKPMLPPGWGQKPETPKPPPGFGPRGGGSAG